MASLSFNLTKSVNHFESCVRNQGFRNSDALVGLVVLQYRSYYAGQSQCGAVKCVAELGFLLAGLAVAALEAVGLIGVKV